MKLIKFASLIVLACSFMGFGSFAATAQNIPNARVDSPDAAEQLFNILGVFPGMGDFSGFRLAQIVSCEFDNHLPSDVAGARCYIQVWAKVLVIDDAEQARKFYETMGTGFFGQPKHFDIHYKLSNEQLEGVLNGTEKVKVGAKNIISAPTTYKVYDVRCWERNSKTKEITCSGVNYGN